MRDYRSLGQKQISEMNGQEIEELMFHAAKGANDQLFNGLAKRFLLQMEEDMRSIHERLEQLERLVKMLIESKQEVKKEINVEEWKPNPKIQEAIANLDKDALKKSLEGAMKVSTIPVPKVELPKMKGVDEK